MDSKQYLALKASAGSGKTFALAMRYISLLFNGANPNEILTLTFTKKAALEMNRRILENLISLRTNKNAQTLILELQNYGISNSMIADNIENIYKKFLQANTKITTIDAFLNLILKKFCWYAGVSHRYEIEFEEKNKIYEDLLSSLSPKDFREFLDLCIYQDINAESMLDLLSFLDAKDFDLKNHIPADENEIIRRDRDKEILDIAQEIKNAIIQNEKASDTAKNAIKTDSVKELVKNLKWLKDGQGYRYFKKLDLKQLEPKFETLKDMLKGYYNHREYVMLDKIGKFLKFYKNNKRKHSINSLSFDAITLKVYELLGKNFDSEFFYFRLDDKITHILIDEFQDTSTIQYKILKPIIDEIRSGQGRFGDRSVFFVGDTKQSIYRFRGSNSELFDIASKGEGITQEDLQYNYRSCENIISYVNKCFENVISDYTPQKYPLGKTSEVKGYVKVCEPCENMQESVWENLNYLLQNNISAEDIAILCFSNDDVLDIRDYIKSKNPELEIMTETNIKLLNQNESKIIFHAIDFFKTNLEFHKKCAYKLAGLAYDADMLMPIKKPYQSLQSFILEIMETFKIYGKAAQKILEISCEYESVDDFLESINKKNIDFSMPSAKGLQMMTIHKSKGLEFKYVILCERIKKPNSDRGKFLFDYEGIELKRIFYKQSKREEVDKEYENALQNEKNLQIRESLNTVYVAFTRAREGLIILPKQKKDGDKDKICFGDLEVAPEVIGSPQGTGHSKVKESKITPIFIEQKSFGKQEDFIKEADDYADTNYIDMKFGEALHKALEYELGHRIKEEKISHILNNHYGFFLPVKSFDDIFRRIENLKKNDMFNSIISESLIKSEISYLSNNILSRIDVMVLKEDGKIIVLDYKTGIHNQEEHKKQVKRYLDFVQSRSKNKSQVQAYILYIRDRIDFIPVS
ncbi:RecB-like helicase [Helicobacter cappadocius]|uniref:DNA 3'-5' helicase n=1 Tax=Helicobacter cappadocius TaxID=3063998 RepID=A0AA90T5D5_9HELI|nr:MULTISPECIES: RecB-like helicase [unclassified Helicobacter]MDO7253433.1 RecB-like helicase [Helicobacter sp. faydin-H75]MDP2539303.1 RecB-like helicase [Helicobacter sp. faydin-H76]